MQPSPDELAAETAVSPAPAAEPAVSAVAEAAVHAAPAAPAAPAAETAVSAAAPAAETAVPAPPTAGTAAVRRFKKCAHPIAVKKPPLGVDGGVAAHTAGLCCKTQTSSAGSTPKLRAICLCSGQCGLFACAAGNLPVEPSAAEFCAPLPDRRACVKRKGSAFSIALAPILQV